MLKIGDKYTTSYGPGIVSSIDTEKGEFTVQRLNVYGGAKSRTPISDQDLYETFIMEDEDIPICSECGLPCEVIPLDNSFDYSGTHCTHGNGGTHYPPDYGTPVSDCCEQLIDA